MLLKRRSSNIYHVFNKANIIFFNSLVDFLVKLFSTSKPFAFQWSPRYASNSCTKSKINKMFLLTIIELI